MFFSNVWKPQTKQSIHLIGRVICGKGCDNPLVTANCVHHTHHYPWPPTYFLCFLWTQNHTISMTVNNRTHSNRFIILNGFYKNSISAKICSLLSSVSHKYIFPFCVFFLRSSHLPRGTMSAAKLRMTPPPLQTKPTTTKDSLISQKPIWILRAILCWFWHVVYLH